MLTMRGAVKVTAIQIFMLHIMCVSVSETVDLNECHTFVTDGHLKSLDEMINSQVESSCITEVQLLQKGSLSDYCYTRGLVYQLYNLMVQHMNFKNNQVFQNNTAALKDMYKRYIKKCVVDDSNGKLMEKPTICTSDKEYLTTIQILEKVKKLFIDAKYFRLNYTVYDDCDELYERECEEKQTNAGLPQCDCHSPTPTNLPRSTIQKPPREISVFRRSTYSSVIHPTTDSARDISARTPGTYVDMSTGSPTTLENIVSSAFTFKDTSTESQFPQTTMEDPYFTSNLQSVTSGSVSPPTGIGKSQTITNTQGRSETLKATTENPVTNMKPNSVGTTFLQFLTQPQQITESNDTTTGQLHANLVSSNTNKNNPYFTTNSLPTIMPLYANNELHSTSELRYQTTFQNPDVEGLPNPSPSPLPSQNLFSVSSMEVEEISPHNAVTKTHRAIGTPEQTFITTMEINAANTHNYVGSSPEHSSIHSTAQFSHITEPNYDRSVSQEDEKKESNLGWADNFVTSASSLSLTKFAITEKRPLSHDTKTSLHSKKTAHEGGAVHQKPYLSEGNIAARISQNRDSDAGGPSPGSNPLLIIETESKTEESHKMEKHKMIVTAIMGMLGILCLGGLLYGLLYKRKYQMLKRQLNRERHDPEIPEERPLNTQQIELELL